MVAVNRGSRKSPRRATPCPCPALQGVHDVLIASPPGRTVPNAIDRRSSVRSEHQGTPVADGFPMNACLRAPVFVAIGITLSGCTSLHRAQLDEIDLQHGYLRPFAIHVSETGVDVRAIGALASAATHSERPSRIAALVSLFEFGPKTGEVVFNDTFADHVADAILAQCPSARVTGLMSVRESTNYYAVSGEYVTVRGFCIVD
jgi:hypothetical protein